MHKDLQRIDANDFKPIKELEEYRYLMKNKNSSKNYLPEEVVFKIYRDAPIEIQTDEILNNIENLRKLEHKYIIKCYGVCAYRGYLTLVMGYSIEPVMSKSELHPQFPRLARDRILDLIEAIQYSVQANYPIFDIRPSTIRLHGYGGIHDLEVEYTRKPIPLHYGQAISLFANEAEYSLHNEDAIVYECIHTEQSVIHAIGIILYEILQGERLFGAKTKGEIFTYMRENKNKLPFELLKDQDFSENNREFEAIIKKATSKNKDDQYKNLCELKSALEGLKFFEGTVHKAGAYELKSLNPNFDKSNLSSVSANIQKVLLAIKNLISPARSENTAEMSNIQIEMQEEIHKETKENSSTNKEA